MFDLFLKQSNYRDRSKRSHTLSSVVSIKGTVVKRRSPWRHALYIRSTLINHLFVGKDIAVRQEKEIHENSRFLRVHAATPWRWNVIGLIFMMYEMQTLITFACRGKIYSGKKYIAPPKDSTWKKTSHLQIASVSWWKVFPSYLLRSRIINDYLM